MHRLSNETFSLKSYLYVTYDGMLNNEDSCKSLILQARLPRLERGTYGLEVRCSVLVELQAPEGCILSHFYRPISTVYSTREPLIIKD